MADFDNNQDGNLDDFTILKIHFGQAAPAAPAPIDIVDEATVADDEPAPVRRRVRRHRAWRATARPAPGQIVDVLAAAAPSLVWQPNLTGGRI